MSLFSRLFPSAHQRQLLRALAGADAAFGHHAVWPLIRKELVAGVYHRPSRQRKISQTDDDAFNSIVFGSYRLALAQLGSGENHVYRATLGIVGAQFKAFSLHAIELLQGTGFLSTEDAIHERSNIEEQVRVAG
jgi:hypothetical protein